MAGTVSEGLSRITIVAPQTRMDLTLPADVPLAELLPTLLRHAGEDLADQGTDQGGWSLRRLGGPALDLDRSTDELEVRDGELLYLRPHADSQPEVVFDDVVDAVATGTQRRASRWTLTDTRRFGVGLTTAALIGGALALLFAGPPQLVSGLVAAGLGLVLLVAATLTARLARDRATAGVLALVGIGYGGLGGLLVFGGDTPVGGLGAPHVLFAATLVVVYGAIATLGVGSYAHIFLGASLGGLLLALGSGLSVAFAASPATAAAIVATLTFGLMPLHPMLAYRLARLPTPTIPTGPDDLKSDTSVVDGGRVLLLSDRAAAYLTGLIVTSGLVVASAVVVILLDYQLPGLLFAALLSLLLLLRARPLPGRPQRLAVLLTGAAGLAAVATTAFLDGELVIRLAVVLVGVLAVAVISATYGLAVAGRRISPMWGRTLDILEILMIVAVVPLAAWVGGLYGWIATIGR